jgi:hypothetical protein
MMSVKLSGHQEVIAALGDIAKQQAPFAMSQTINDLLFLGKQAINAAQDKKYEGGATRWSKAGIGYVKSTKQALVGLIHLSDDPKHDYLKYGINGGRVTPTRGQKAIKVPSKGQGLDRRGNFRFSGGRTYAGKELSKGASTNPSYFIGIPKNIERMPFFTGRRSSYYGVWKRHGKPGPRGGIGRKVKITMSVALEKGRTDRPYFKSPEQYAISVVKKRFLPIFNARLVKAIATAK